MRPSAIRMASAAPVDADAAGERRHRDGTASLARRLHAVGALREGISAEDAGVQISLLTSRHAYDELVRDRGWGYDQAATWIERTLTAQLLRP